MVYDRPEVIGLLDSGIERSSMFVGWVADLRALTDSTIVGWVGMTALRRMFGLG
jgi:hypothetical protein